jgi:uncharacterized OsmC-like protein
MDDGRQFDLTLRLEEGYRFSVEFDDPAVAPLVVDEPAPLGGGEGPNAVRLLGAAVGNCLAASLLFCLKRSRVEVSELRVGVTGRVERNESGRHRVAGLRVRLHPGIAEADRDRLRRCEGLFEDFCIVTQSVRDGLDVEVEVEPVEAGAGV